MNMAVYKRDNLMKSFTNEEYLALCQKLLEEQYDEALDDYNIEDMECVPSATVAKKKREKANSSGMIDLTDAKSNTIKSQLFKCTNLKVGMFKLRIRTWNDNLDDDKMLFSVEVWEERHKTPSGMPCKIDFAMNFAKDSRFKDRPWLKYFGGGNSAYQMPIDTIVEVIRWMQIVKKLTAFL